MKHNTLKPYNTVPHIWAHQNHHHAPLLQKFDPLNAELNPICHLLALLGAHHILHVSRKRVKKHKSICNMWFIC